MTTDLQVYLLAYPDNPVGNAFIKIFLKHNVPMKGIIVERKKGKTNWTRLKKKVHKDGFMKAFKRFLNVLFLKMSKQNIVDLATKNGIDVYWVDKFNSKACAALLESLNIDLLTIVSAPILKEYIFTKAKSGCLNAHPGWLPKYRGLGANAYAIQNGDSPGVTVHFIDAGIDTGRIIVREKLSVNPGQTVAQINDQAMARGAELMASVIQKISENCLVMPSIDEPAGEMVYAMSYSSVKKINQQLRDSQFIKNLK